MAAKLNKHARGKVTCRLVIEVGMDSFIYWPADDRLRQIELFAAEVVPAVQEQVARAREKSSDR